MRLEVQNYCNEIGSSRLLVQGAGGNISWKDNDNLWVKASGKWIKNSLSEDIFVQVDLEKLIASISSGKFDVIPDVIGSNIGNASIETMLHAMLPHKIVLHLHPIEILIYLIRADSQKIIGELGSKDFNPEYISYRQPGAELAQLISSKIASNKKADLLYLENHGIVIGGETITDIDKKLRRLIGNAALLSNFEENLVAELGQSDKGIDDNGSLLIPAECPEINALSQNPRLFDLVKKGWALYPDHVVFLGAQALTICYDDNLNFNEVSCRARKLGVKLVFLEGIGTFSLKPLTIAETVQLICYFDVLSRLDRNIELRTLSPDEVKKLLNWDAERYRQRLNS